MHTEHFWKWEYKTSKAYRFPEQNCKMKRHYKKKHQKTKQNKTACIGQVSCCIYFTFEESLQNRESNLIYSPPVIRSGKSGCKRVFQWLDYRHNTSTVKINRVSIGANVMLLLICSVFCIVNIILTLTTSSHNWQPKSTSTLLSESEYRFHMSHKTEEWAFTNSGNSLLCLHLVLDN